MSTMGLKDTREWAKEEIISMIDKQFDDFDYRIELDADERAALLHQRNRIAKMFKLAERASFYKQLPK